MLHAYYLIRNVCTLIHNKDLWQLSATVLRDFKVPEAAVHAKKLFCYSFGFKD